MSEAEEIIYLAELTAYDPSIPGTITLRIATKGVVSGGNYYEPRLLQAGNYTLNLFQPGKTAGMSEVGHGEVVVNNYDGGCDAWINYGFAGRSIVLRKLVAGVLTLLTSCTMEQPVGDSELSIRIKDPQMSLNVPVQATKYAGTNSLPDGIEGTDDIKGRPKALTFGHVAKDATHSSGNVTPNQVNTSKLIYHVGPVYDIPAAYDKGVPLTKGTNYTGQADMEANPPAPGYYRAWPAGGCFRLGSMPQGQVTADVIEGATAADRTAAQVAKRILAYAAPSVTISAADVTALDAANPAEVGIYIKDEMTIIEALDQVLGSVGAWYTFDVNNVLRIKRLEAVDDGATPDAVISASQILEHPKRLASNDEGRGVPVKQVNLSYGKNYTVQSKGDLAGIVESSIRGQGLWTPITNRGWSGPTNIAYGNGRFVAMYGSGTAAKMSLDGKTWTTVTMPASNIWRVTFGNGMFVAVGSNSGTNAAYSTDGIIWTAATLPVAAQWNDVAYGNGVFVAIAHTGISPDTNTAATSVDGITWVRRPFSSPSGPQWQKIEYGNGLFVLIPGASGTAFASSPDGITWTARTFPANDLYMGAAFGNNVFVFLNLSGNTYVTTDCISWSTASLIPSNSAITAWGDILYGDGLFMAISWYGVSAVSIDGKAWFQRDIPYDPQWGTLGYGDGLFVVMSGSGTSLSTYRILADTPTTVFVGSEFRTVKSAADTASPSVTDIYPTAGELNVTTLLTKVADAQSEANRQFALYKLRHDTFEIQVPASVLAYLEPGKLVKLYSPRFGLVDGKLFLVLGITVNWESGTTTLIVWR